eukprot:361665-Amorphochlora_amoeboformis.AAC.1
MELLCLDNKTQAIASFGKYSVVIVSTNKNTAQLIGGVLFRSLQSSSKKANIAVLNGGFPCFKVHFSNTKPFLQLLTDTRSQGLYPGVICGTSQRGCVTDVSFDTPLPLPSVIVPGNVIPP